MSDADRRKWDERYRSAASGERNRPSEFLTGWLPQIPSGRALDVACGTGRNALCLAEAGFTVDAVDVSSEGLARAGQRAHDRGVAVNWVEQDLDAGIPGDDPYDLILMIRYVNPALLASLVKRLRPGGYLLCEVHLATTADVIGPRNPRFRVQPGELRKVAGSMHILFCDESLHAGPDGSTVALARLVARVTAQEPNR